MAYLKKRSNTWYAVWLQDGKKIAKTTGLKATQKNRAAALVAANQMEALAKKTTTTEKAVAAIKATAKAFCERKDTPKIADYLKKHKVGGKDSSQSNFDRAAQELLDHLGVMAAKEIDWLDKKTCENFIKSLETKLSQGTIRTHKDYLHAAFEKAKKDGLIEKNPFTGITLKRATSATLKREVFTQEEMQRLLTETSYPWKEAVKISYYTGGQRLGDICQLTWGQINWTEQTIYVQTMKTGRDMSVPILPALMETLKELQKRNGKSKYVLPELQARYTRSKGGASTDFTSMLNAMGIGKKIQSKSGGLLSVKSFHSIRHTTVTALRESEKISIDVAHEIVGQNSEIVQRAYSHPSRKKKEEALQILEEAINVTEEEQEKRATDAFLEALKKSEEPQKLLKELLEKLKKA